MRNAAAAARSDRAYWLPSCPAGVAPETRTSYHPGPLLDPRTLPKLQPEPKGPRLADRSMMVDSDRQHAATYMRQVLDNVATMARGGRNAALNHAAWTLGGWVAAGKLAQRGIGAGMQAHTKVAPP